MSISNFRVIYDGPALSSHEMDIRALAPALLAFSDLLEEANKVLNGEDIKVSVNVKGSFQSGSFGIHLNVHQDLINKLIGIFNHQAVTGGLNLWGILGFIGVGSGGGLIGLMKWAKSRKFSNVEVLTDGNCRIFIGSEFLDVEKKVLDLYRNHKIRKGIESAIYQPLTFEGIDTFASGIEGQSEFVTVSQDERAYFRANDADELIGTNIRLTNVQVVLISFADGNKWRFTEGGSAFWATISDEPFMARVNNSQEFFSRDDLLKVELSVKQWRRGTELSEEHEILRVLDHIRAPQQLRLPDSQ